MSSDIGEKIVACLLTYNHAHLIESTLTSIQQQTLKDYEIIVSDDCSTDDTWEIIQRMARCCIHAGVRRFVGVGTCAEYDLSQGMLRTDTPLNPDTLYAACKASVFQILRQLLPAAGIQFAWCRVFYLYGEGEDPRRLVPYLRQKLCAGEPAELTSGNQIRDFLDVRDVGVMIVEAALSDRQGAINICSGIPITVRQLAERIADEYGRRDLLHFGARPDNLFDPPCIVGVREGISA